jgi:hypothetical protein
MKRAQAAFNPRPIEGFLSRAYRSQDREGTWLSLNFPMRTLPRERVRIKPMEKISERIIVRLGEGAVVLPAIRSSR